MATSCPPSPTETNQASPTLSSPARATIACRRGAGCAAALAVDYVAGTPGSTATTTYDVTADTSPRTPVANEQFAFYAANTSAGIFVDAVNSVRTRRIGDKTRSEKRPSFSGKSDDRSSPQTDLKTTKSPGTIAAGNKPLGTRPASGVQQTAAGGEQSPAAFCFPGIAQFLSSPKTASTSVYTSRRLKSAPTSKATPIPKGNRTAAGPPHTANYATQQSANDAEEWIEKREKPQCQHGKAQQNLLKRHLFFLDATNPLREGVFHATIRPANAPFEDAIARVSDRHKSVAFCQPAIGKAESMHAPTIPPSGGRIRKAGDGAADAQAAVSSRTDTATLQRLTTSAGEALPRGEMKISVREALLRPDESTRAPVVSTSAAAAAVSGAADLAFESATAFHVPFQPYSSKENRPSVITLSPLSGCGVVASTSSPASPVAAAEFSASSRRSSVSGSVSSCSTSKSTAYRLSCDTTRMSFDVAAAAAAAYKGVGVLKSEAAPDIQRALPNVFKAVASSQMLLPEEKEASESTTGYDLSSNGTAVTKRTFSASRPAPHSATCDLAVAVPVCSPALRGQPCSSLALMRPFFDSMNASLESNQQRHTHSSPPNNSRPQRVVCQKQVTTGSLGAPEQNSGKCLAEANWTEKVLPARQSFFVSNANAKNHSPGPTPEDFKVEHLCTEKAEKTFFRGRGGPEAASSSTTANNGSAVASSVLSNFFLCTSLTTAHVETPKSNKIKRTEHQVEEHQPGHKSLLPLSSGDTNAQEEERHLCNSPREREDEGGNYRASSTNRKSELALTHSEDNSTQQHKEDSHRAGTLSDRGGSARNAFTADIFDPPASQCEQNTGQSRNAGAATGDEAYACKSLSVSCNDAAAVWLGAHNVATTAIGGVIQIRQQERQCEGAFQESHAAEEGHQESEPQQQRPQQIVKQNWGCIEYCNAKKASLLLKHHRPDVSPNPLELQSRSDEGQPQQCTQDSLAGGKPSCGCSQEEIHSLELRADPRRNRTVASDLPKRENVCDACAPAGKRIHPEAAANGKGIRRPTGSSEIKDSFLPPADATANVPNQRIYKAPSSSDATSKTLPGERYSSSARRANTPATGREREESIDAEGWSYGAAIESEKVVTCTVSSEEKPEKEERKVRDTAVSKKASVVNVHQVKQTVSVTELSETDVLLAEQSKTLLAVKTCAAAALPIPFGPPSAPLEADAATRTGETPATAPSATPSLPKPEEADVSARTKSTTPVASSKTVNAGRTENEEGLTLTEALLATVGHGVTTVLEYGAATLRDFITESLPALSSDEEISPCSSPGDTHIDSGRDSSNRMRRSGSGSRKQAACENQKGPRHTSGRRAFSAGATPTAESSLQSPWGRCSSSTVLLPPPLLVRECMLPFAGISGGEKLQLPPPLKHTAKAYRRSNSFGEAQHSSQLRPAWNLAALDQTHPKRLPSSFFPPRPIASVSPATRETTEGVADATHKQQRYVRTSSPAHSEPSCLRSVQHLHQPDLLVHYRHHNAALPPGMLAAVAAGKKVAHRRLSIPIKKLENNRCFPAFSKHNSPEHRSGSPSLPPKGFHQAAASSVIPPAGRPPPLPMQQCSRLSLQPQSSLRMPLSSPRRSSRNTLLAAVSPSTVFTTPHAHSPHGDRSIAAGGAAVAMYVGETRPENMVGSGVKRVATSLLEGQQHSSGHIYAPMAPLLTQSVLKEERLPADYLPQAQQAQQQQHQQLPLMRQRLRSPGRHVSPHCSSPAAEHQANPHSETITQRSQVSVSGVQGFQVVHAGHSTTELLPNSGELQQQSLYERKDTHLAARGEAETALMYSTFSNNKLPVASSALQLLPSDSRAGDFGFRHSADNRDRLVLSGTDERNQVGYWIRHTSPSLPNARSSSGGNVDIQQQDETGMSQQHHLVQLAPHVGAAQQLLLPRHVFRAGKQQSSSSPHPVRGAEAVQFHRHPHADDSKAERTMACTSAAVHLAATTRTPMLVRTHHTPVGLCVADAHSTGDVQATWGSLSSSCRGRSPSLPQRQSTLQWPGSCEQQYPFPNTPAMRCDNFATVHGNGVRPAAEGTCTSGGIRPNGVNEGSELSEGSQRTGAKNRLHAFLSTVPDVLACSSAKPPPLLPHQCIYQIDQAYLPEQTTILSEQRNSCLVAEASGGSAGDNNDTYKEVCLSAPPSTHRGERKVQITAETQNNVSTLQDITINWGENSSFVSQQDTRQSCTQVNLPNLNMTKQKQEPFSTSQVACENMVNIGEVRREGITLPASADGEPAKEQAADAGSAATSAGAPQRVDPAAISIGSEHYPHHIMWKQEVLTHLQAESQHQGPHDSHYCRKQCEVKQHHIQGEVVGPPRPPSPFRARWLRENLMRKHATGQLCRENFPLEEVESLLHGLQVKKVNGVLVYDIDGQEGMGDVPTENRAAGPAAVTFTLPDSRSASGCRSKCGSKAGVVRTIQRKDEEGRNGTRVNTNESHIRKDDSSHNHLYRKDAFVCDSSSSNEWNFNENTRVVDRNRKNAHEFESVQHESQSAQHSSRFDAWLQENHRVGEQFLKDVEQIVDVAASLYASPGEGE